MVLTMANCPNCSKRKDDRKYLCHQCWYSLTKVTRTRLLRRDRFALSRLSELYTQIEEDIPLSEIEVAA